MRVPPKPPNEVDRLAAAKYAGVLNTTPDPQFDDLVGLAATICQTPMALVSFIGADTQFLKARLGLDICSTPRDVAFCAYAILQPKMFIVPDTRRDPRFRKHPAVVGDPFIRFYAGMPICDYEGFALGTICVLDVVPRELNGNQIETLQTLAREAQLHLEVRRILNQNGTIDEAAEEVDLEAA